MASSQATMTTDVPHLPLTIDSDDLQSGVCQLIRKIRPEWPEDQLEFKIFTEGYTNKLVGTHIGDLENMVLTKVYGEKTELFLDRDLEKRTMQLLSTHGCAKPLYCTFENGICYGYIQGQVFEQWMRTDRKYATLAARELARYHTLPVPDWYSPGQTRSNYFLQLDKMLAMLPREFHDPARNKRYQEEFPRVPELKAAAEELETIVSSWGDPLVLCHHDLLIKNLVYNKEHDRVYFIDYEFAGLSYPELDIGDTFDEDAVKMLTWPVGKSRENSDDHPAEASDRDSLQYHCLREYLRERHRYHGNRDDVTDEEVEKLCRRVRKMTLLWHLSWGVWGMVQACISPIDFDFLDYAIRKLRLYNQLRPELLAL